MLCLVKECLGPSIDVVMAALTVNSSYYFTKCLQFIMTTVYFIVLDLPMYTAVTEFDLISKTMMRFPLY